MQLPPDEITLKISKNPVDYEQAKDFMQAHVQKIHQKQARDLIWFLEHSPLYTAGTSAKQEDLLEQNRFPVYQTNRGGQYTYHGPGQRIIYVMLDISSIQDVRKFVQALENWVINALKTYDIEARTIDGKVGIWVQQPDNKFDKIAALGIRLRKWISFHGISININPDLSHFNGIVPCGITEQNYGITSLQKLKKDTDMKRFDDALIHTFANHFGSALIDRDFPTP